MVGRYVIGISSLALSIDTHVLHNVTTFSTINQWYVDPEGADGTIK